MAEWLYRATATKADWGATDDALRTHAFMWRSAYAERNKKTGVYQMVPNVRNVRAGDVIHLAFAWKCGKKSFLEGIGSFEVLEAVHHDRGEGVLDNGRLLPLFAVRKNSNLEKMLATTSYDRDPKMKNFVGWHVREVDDSDIAFTKEMFPGNNSLRKFHRDAEDEKDVQHRPVRNLPGTLHFSALPTRKPKQTVALPTSGSALGVDWSGSAQAGKKIWAARVAFSRKGARLDRLWRPFQRLDASGVAGHFATWLAGEGFNTAGLDFCFGLSSQHAVPGLPIAGPTVLGPWLSRFADPVAFKTAVGQERKRETDRSRGAPFAPTNLRMFRQTYWGLRSLAAVSLPILPWSQPAPRAVVEVLPAHVVSVLCPGCRYKGRTLHARGERQTLLNVLKIACRLTVPIQDEQVILDDSEGDALDAVIAAIAAGAAQHARFAGVPAHAASRGEGWIYSVP